MKQQKKTNVGAAIFLNDWPVARFVESLVRSGSRMWCQLPITEG
jgi:hypothetical protein